jgi:hypothetical protein
LVSNKDLIKRYHLIKKRISAYTSLRELVNIPPEADLTQRQWNAIESQLSNVRSKFDVTLTKNAKRYLNNLENPETARKFCYFLGAMQLELSKRLDDYWDLFYDVTTLRCSKIGVLLAGCDAIAFDAIKKNHPLLETIEPPITFCNRGYAAATIRQGIKLSRDIVNPIQLIQIPWQKPWYGLPSLIHEIGHNMIELLGLTKALKSTFIARLSHIGLPTELVNVFVNCVPEIASDFYSFCCVGLAQTFTTMEVLSLPPKYVFGITYTGVHPPPYWRVLLSIEWSRNLWGEHISSELKEKWLNRYPVEMLSSQHKELLELGRNYLQLISNIMLNTKFACLNNKRITDLFDMENISPWKLEQKASTSKSSTLDLTGLSPCEQLAVFGFIRERYDYSEELMDTVMKKWLIKLAHQRDFGNLRTTIDVGKIAG